MNWYYVAEYGSGYGYPHGYGYGQGYAYGYPQGYSYGYADGSGYGSTYYGGVPGAISDANTSSSGDGYERLDYQAQIQA